MNAPYAIEASGLTKRFGERVAAAANAWRSSLTRGRQGRMIGPVSDLGATAKGRR